jgi:hypothetical protein
MCHIWWVQCVKPQIQVNFIGTNLFRWVNLTQIRLLCCGSTHFNGKNPRFVAL